MMKSGMVRSVLWPYLLGFTGVVGAIAAVSTMFAGFILAILLVALAIVATPVVSVMGLMSGNQGSAPVYVAGGPLSTSGAWHQASALLTGRTKVGSVEWGFAAAAAALIAGEIAAVIGDLGPIFAVVAVGYLLVLGASYLLYRHHKTSRWIAAGAHIEATAVQVAGNPEADLQLLRQADIFKGLSDHQLDQVAGLTRRMTVVAGESLGTQGEGGVDLLIIAKGQAQLSTRSAVGEITVRVAGPGESLPLATLVGPGTLITSIEAMTHMELLVVSRASLLSLCSRNPEIGMQIYASIAELLANRYRHTLGHLTISAERALKETGFFANV